jgi:hypothetical protein
MDYQFRQRTLEMTPRGNLTFNFLQLLAAALLLVAVGCVLWEVWGEVRPDDCPPAHHTVAPHREK